MNAAKTINSREVATMVGKQHKDLLRNIRGYIQNMIDGGERKIAPTDFFVESSYLTEQNKSEPCYQVTRKGCEFIANKLTGKKGVLFTAAYINRFHEMETAVIVQKSTLTAKDRGAGDAASLIKVVVAEMNRNKTPKKIVMKYIYHALSEFNLPNLTEPEMVYISPIEQLTLVEQSTA